MQRRFVARWMTTMAAVFALAAVGCQSTGGSESGSSSGRTGSEFREGPMGSESSGDGSGTDVSSLQTVYFDYDVFTIRSDAKPALRDNARAIRDHEEGVSSRSRVTATSAAAKSTISLSASAAPAE